MGFLKVFNFDFIWMVPLSRTSHSWYKVILNELDVEDSFGFLGDERDACKRKVLCHLHSFLPSSPTWLQTIFRIIR